MVVVVDVVVMLVLVLMMLLLLLGLLPRRARRELMNLPLAISVRGRSCGWTAWRSTRTGLLLLLGGGSGGSCG